jgi:uncharacterized protein (DUF983 family)
MDLPSNTRVVLRGLVRHCGRCGSGHLYKGWFKLVDRCPKCGYLFDREEGFFLGAFVINFVVTELLLGVILGVMIVQEASSGSVSLPVLFTVAAAETILVPIVFYPFSKTIWAAIDMVMHRQQVFADYPGPPAGIK